MTAPGVAVACVTAAPVAVAAPGIAIAGVPAASPGVAVAAAAAVSGAGVAAARVSAPGGALVGRPARATRAAASAAALGLRRRHHDLALALRLPADLLTATPLVFVGVLDLREDAAHVDRRRRALEAARELEVRGERVALVGGPELLPVRPTAGARREAREERREVVHVADQQLLGVAVLRRVDRLREVDDHRPVGIDEDVVIREVAVHDPRAQHLDDLAEQALEVRGGRLSVEVELRQPRRGVSVVAADELHDQHPVDEVPRGGDAHTLRVEPVDHVDLGRLPGLLLLRSAVAAAPVDGPLVARVADPTTLRVLGALLERALARVLVDLGHPHVAAGAHEVDLGLLAALEGTDDLVDDALVGQRPQHFRYAHELQPLAGRGMLAIGQA